MHRASCTQLLHASGQCSFARLSCASLHCTQASYLLFSGVSLVPFLPSGGGGEGTLSKASRLPPQLTPLHFPLVCSLHHRFPHLSQRNLNHCLLQLTTMWSSERRLGLGVGGDCRRGRSS